MTKHEIVALPRNLDEISGPYFKPYSHYKFEKPKIRELKNVFVAYSGFAINKQGLVKESHHDYPESLQDYIDEASYYYYTAERDSSLLEDLDNQVLYLLIHHPWFNYYHWLCEAIPRLWMVKDRLDRMCLLLPNDYKHSDFIVGSLKPFQIKNIHYLERPKSAFVAKLCLPAIKPICDAYDKKQLIEIRNFYLSYIKNETKIDINVGERIYLSRKKAARKKVINEEEVEKLLKKFDFKIVYNEDYTFLEQVSLYSHARYLVSIHGSGLTNMLFMQENSVVYEILKPKTNVLDRPSFVFWYQADALDFSYYQQLAFPDDANDDYFFGDFTIDIHVMEQNLNKIFK